MNNVKCLSKDNLLFNLEYIKSFNKKIMVMVKAEAYGHDLKAVGSLLKGNVSYFGVANEKEALKLKLILNDESVFFIASKCNNFKMCIKNGFHITIDSVIEAKKIIEICKKSNKKAYVHIAINTGMNRIGVKTLKEFQDILKFIDENSRYICLKGIFTHCFNADEKRSSYFIQMERFKRYARMVKNRDILLHVGGSFVLLHKLPKCINMVRVGFFLYGYGNVNLKPVMAIKSKVVKITKCKKGEYIGYGKTKLKKDKIIAQIPIGYADGVPRKLSNKAFVKVSGLSCKIVGSICMDCMFIDITNKNIKVGDSVTIFNNADYYAKILDTSPYEILTNFSRFRGRVIVNSEE